MRECPFAKLNEALIGEVLTHDTLNQLVETCAVAYDTNLDAYMLTCRRNACALGVLAILGDRFEGINIRHCLQRQENPTYMRFKIPRA